MITAEQLKKIVPTASQANIAKFIGPLNDTMAKYSINTPLRMAAFIAQVAHESGSFMYVKELASGSAYEGRKDLGNVHTGDGVKFKGRGLIQITGYTNYSSVAKAFGIDCLNKPELLEQPAMAAMTAGWFWNQRQLNILADVQNFELITKKINGGLNGYADRCKFYSTAKQVLIK